MRIGAELFEGACVFRVWAPNADAVSVEVQRAPRWEKSVATKSVALARGGSGYWIASVPGVLAGDLYRYRLQRGADILQRLDPAARDVLHSALTHPDAQSDNASIVVDPSYDWAPFDTPRFENFIIYELHVGSFCGRNDGSNVDIATFEQLRERLPYIREMGFNAIELMPVHEFAMDRSWGYNPGSFFAPESAYGSPDDLRALVDAAHRMGLAVIFDLVYNHAGPGDNVLWAYDGDDIEGGIYFEGGKWTDWGRGPAWHKDQVSNFFQRNAEMFLSEYNADGLRFDVTTQIDGNYLKEVVWRLRNAFPSKYFIAEHLPAHRWITTFGNFCATWQARVHHETQRALVGDDPVGRMLSILGWDDFDHTWNLVRYPLGSHDDIGDDHAGNAEDGLSRWDSRHRYLIDLLGGRDDWTARAKCRLAWVLAVTMPGTPMLFMGSESHMGAPSVGWGYWHDGTDHNGDHRFDWDISGDSTAIPMRRLVAACNQLRWDHPSLRSETLSVVHVDALNQVVAFKRYHGGDVILTVLHFGHHNFTHHGYGVATGGQEGQWSQRLCSQDAEFGGWEGSGNAYHEPWTTDGRIFINLPRLSALVFVLK